MLRTKVRVLAPVRPSLRGHTSSFRDVLRRAVQLGLLFSALASPRAWAYTPQFPLKQGWLGADTAASIPLDGRHRVLWLFSDTYVRQDTGTNRHGAGFVNNSLAVTTWNGYTTNIDYYIRGRDQGAMTSVFPSPGSDSNGNWWYWVGDGFKYNGKIYVFLDRERRTGTTMWSFQHFATDLAILDNVENERNPLLWPLTIQKDVLDSTNFMVGVSAYVDAASGYAFLWGTKTVNVSGWNYVYMVLFRLALNQLNDPGPNLEYYTTLAAWRSAVGSDLSDAQLIMSNGSPDFSIRYHPDLGLYVDIQCDDGFPAARIWERTSSSPFSGWPSGAGASTLVTFANEPGYMPWPVFHYAAKEHLEFYSPVSGRALLTYCDNSSDTGAISITNVLNNNSLYVPTPRWVQLGPANANHPPSSCIITSPGNGQNFPGLADIPVTVSATDPDTNDAIVLVNVFVDGVLAASTGTAPFNCLLRGLGAGSHTIYAEAYDTVEAKTNSSTISISVAPFTITNYAAEVLSDSPLYYWPFNETNGSAVACEYYNRLDFLYGSSTTNGVPGPVPPLYGFASNNLAVAMDTAVPAAGAGYVSGPPLNLNTNSASFVAWVYPFAHVTNAAGILFSRASTYAVGFGYLGGGRILPDQLSYTWNQTNPATYTWLSRLYTPPGQWSFVALTISPTQAVLYSGTTGTLYSAANAIAHTNELWDGPTTIGSDTASGSNRVFNGKIDEVSVYNYTLSPDQVTNLYRMGMLGGPVMLRYGLTATNLVLCWEHGTLLGAPDINGPWAPVPGASPPSCNITTLAPAFYRVRAYP
ncbi:MAG TPA: LamG-like jellyroll fold domain-containing protein [Verrucomicrobiae bacterium]|nr:LamG-like jellyroll fold domain-containing protein [Verrucomicrobiae bacterium]